MKKENGIPTPMNETELRKQFPNASQSFIAANSDRDPRLRPRPVVQEQQGIVRAKRKANLPSWTASSVPFDDSVDWIPEISVSVERVEKGQEGATVVIERLT